MNFLNDFGADIPRYKCAWCHKSSKDYELKRITTVVPDRTILVCKNYEECYLRMCKTAGHWLTSSWSEERSSSYFSGSLPNYCLTQSYESSENHLTSSQPVIYLSAE
jgi:hypothetical protein